MTEIKQDCGDVFTALAQAFGALGTKAQEAAITEIYDALTKLIEQRLDEVGVAAEDATDHDAVRPLMLAVNMIRTMFGSHGRVRVFRVHEAAVVINVASYPHVEAYVIAAGEGGEVATVLARRLLQIYAQETPPKP